MRAILPLIPLLLSLVPLSCVSVLVENPTITCKQAVEALQKGQNLFSEPTGVQAIQFLFPSFSTPPYSCVNNGEAIFRSSGRIGYLLQDENKIRHLLEVYWGRNMEAQNMISHVKWAWEVFKRKKHSNIQEMIKFVRNNVGADGNPVKNGDTADPKENWLVYYTLLEYGPHGTLKEFLTNNPDYASKFPWICRIFFRIAHGAVHLNNLGIIHTEISLDKVFLASNFEPKLFLPYKPATKGEPGRFQGRVDSVAPEVLAVGQNFEEEGSFRWSEKQDIYSLGMLLYRMLFHGKFPFGSGEDPISSTRDTAGAQVLPPNSENEEIKKKILFEKIKQGDFQVGLKITFRFLMVLHGCFRYIVDSRWGYDQIMKTLVNLSSGDADPTKVATLRIWTELTLDTPIGYPEHKSDKTIKISTKRTLKGPDVFIAENLEFPLKFDPQKPEFLYNPLPLLRPLYRPPPRPIPVR